MTDIQRAAAYYYVQRQAFASRPQKPSLAASPDRPVRCRAAVARQILPQVAERLKDVMLENLPWERFLKLYDAPETFFFIDPPYIGHDDYRHNFKREDMAALASALKTIKGRFLMTHSDSPEIRSLFNGQSFEPIEVTYSAHTQTKRFSHLIGQEILISNY